VHSTGYIIRFILIITAVAALVLAFMATALRPVHQMNEAIYNKRAILSAVEDPLGSPVSELSDQEVQQIFEDKVEQKVLDMQGHVLSSDEVMTHGYADGKAEDVDMAKERKRPESERFLPLFVFNDNGDEYYIVSVRGNGLWDEIWGNIALKQDFETIAGAAFDHKGETPGLGAEIKDNPNFSEQFEGKKIYDENGEYTSIIVRKGGAKNDRNEVDGISGATITANGVQEMLYRGIKYYEPYFDSISTTN
jgi:Na+-transporting NADH:ubiquinone oxidoreductase subunit C